MEKDWTPRPMEFHEDDYANNLILNLYCELMTSEAPCTFNTDLTCGKCPYFWDCRKLKSLRDFMKNLLLGKEMKVYVEPS